VKGFYSVPSLVAKEYNSRIMEQIKSFTDARQVLQRYVPKSRSMSAPYTLERMQQLMVALGNPQDQLRVVHVAGTSGKTSTSYYIASLLKAAGQKTGLTVSPHIDEVNERLQIDLEPLPEAVYCQVLSEFINLVDKTGIKPTYFELLVALAYWYFARQKVNYAVIEVGLGGLLDGTNVVSRPDKVCVITDIGLDHTSVLGKTLPEITSQKAGIIHPHNAVFCYQQSAEIMAVIREVSRQQQAELHEVRLPSADMLPTHLPLYQQRNWYLATHVHDYLTNRDNLPQVSAKDLQITTRTSIPARMEIVQRAGHTLVIDGAHNGQKLAALGASLENMFNQQKTAVVFSLVQSSQLRLKTSLKALIGFTDHLIVTSFETQQDFLKQSINPRKIVEQCRELGFTNIEVIPDPKEAYQALLKRPEPVHVVTGSFYLLNHIRPLVFKHKS